MSLRDDTYYAYMRHFQYINIAACGAAARVRRGFCYTGNPWEKDMTSMMVLEFLRLTQALPERELEFLTENTCNWLDSIR